MSDVPSTSSASSSSQFQVASEFGYCHEHIRKLLEKKPYLCAGDLIEDLENYVSEEEETEDETLAAAIVKEEEKVGATSDCDKTTNLRAETEKLFRESVCLVCRATKRTRVCLPCCHLTHCEKCESSVKICPEFQCREIVQYTIHTYF